MATSVIVSTAPPADGDDELLVVELGPLAGDRHLQHQRRRRRHATSNARWHPTWRVAASAVGIAPVWTAIGHASGMTTEWDAAVAAVRAGAPADEAAAGSSSS